MHIVYDLMHIVVGEASPLQKGFSQMLLPLGNEKESLESVKEVLIYHFLLPNLTS